VTGAEEIRTLYRGPGEGSDGHTWGTGEMCTKFCPGSLKGRDHQEDEGLDGRIILKWILRKWYWCVD
jgi:hypothetical protein